ncbi:MAG: hemolysin family protein [Gemmatimonadota bacterium]
MSPVVLLALLFALCLLLSMLFTAVESAHLARRSAAGEGEEAPPDLLHALALGDLACDLGAAAAAALGLRFLYAGDPGAGAWTALVLGLTLVLLIPCEMVPRQVAAVDPGRTLRRWGPWLRPWLWITRPFAGALTRLSSGLRRVVAGSLRVVRLTTDDVRSVVETVDQHLELENEERDMVQSIFAFGETTVREVMVPRPDIVGVPEGAALPELLQAAREAEHSRLPVYRETLDHVVGIVHVKDLLARRYGLDGGQALEGVVREPFFVPESKKIDDLLREFQHGGRHMAIVVDEYGGTAGLVTIEDILEEIVGEIQDEHDVEEPLWALQPDGSFVVDARMDLDDFGEVVAARIEGDGFETVGGLVYSLLGRVPEAGEEVVSGGLTLRVTELDGRRIQKLHVSRLPAEARVESPGAAAGAAEGES